MFLAPSPSPLHDPTLAQSDIRAFGIAGLESDGVKG